MMNKLDLQQLMPAMYAHEGEWAGNYRHINWDGVIHDEHQARVRCTFPETGPYAYIQHNHFTWADGREQTAVLPGTYRDGALWWDVPSFHGKAWETQSGLILLELWRKDLPGAWFWEVICMAKGGQSRVRTWHWFDANGQPFRRTLCNETRIA